MKKVLLLLNPSSRSGAHFFDDARNFLKEKGHTVLNTQEDIQNSTMVELILKYRANCDIVVIGGGDGTVNVCLPGLLETKLPMALIPLGTANNMARTLEIPTDLKSALELVDTGRQKKVDLGVVNGIHFVNVVGLGLSTDVNRKVPHDLKKKIGVFAFIWTAFRLSYRMTPFRTTITCDGESKRSLSWQISICNGKHYGSGLVIEEDASLTDSLLNCLSTEVKRWWHGFFLIPAILTGRYKPEDDVSLFLGRSIKIETRKTMKVDIDGDVKTKTPLELSVLPRALEVIVPQKKISKEAKA